VARRTIRRVTSEGAFLGLALAGELERADLAPDDRGLATAIAYGVIRHQTRLDRALSAHARRGLGKLSPTVRVALAVAAYQILFLDRVPAHAAVNDAVSAVRRVAGPRMGGFANGLLRELARSGEPPLPDRANLAAHLEVACSLPRWILAELDRALPAGELEPAALAFSAPAPLWARFDPGRVSAEALVETLTAERPGASVLPSALARGAARIAGIGSPETSASFQDGLWTVQDLGAQLVAHMIRPEPGQRVLDACAGVGGKSMHLAQLARGEALIDAADLSPRKLDLLRDTARRLQVSSVRPIESDLVRPGSELAARYGAILLDAPCTGLGVLRRHPERKGRGDASAIAELAALAGQLLDALAPRVAPGGLLVFSVCTITRAEGPDQLAGFLAAHPEFAVEPPSPSAEVPDWSPVLAADGTVHTWPHRQDADGFFAARLRRGG
jgi:16S rRNA (cytosine967-C5)-methyltransferase